MRIRTQLAIMMTVLPILSGCVVVDLHSTRPVRVKVTSTKTGEPISNAVVNVSYSYHSYGVYYVLRTPEGVSGTTDVEGTAVLPMADYRHGFIGIRVDEVRLGTYDEEVIRKGGVLDGRSVFDSGGPRERVVFPRLRVELTPLK